MAKNSPWQHGMFKVCNGKIDHSISKLLSVELFNIISDFYPNIAFLMGSR